MTDKENQGYGRRRVLRVAGVAGLAAIVLPQSWAKPVLRSVVVPAHAQTTPASKTTETTSTTNTTETKTTTRTRTTRTTSTTATSTTATLTTVTLTTFPTDAGSLYGEPQKSRLAMIIDSLGLMKS